MKNETIRYKSDVSKHKPNTLHNRSLACPFCDIGTLRETNSIVSENGAKRWITNKFPVLENSYPLVYIENDQCDKDMTNYPRELLVDILSEGIEKWMGMLQDDRYKGALFFKNHGPHSSGSIHHPHMQLIGLYDNDPVSRLSFDEPDGPAIFENPHFSWCWNAEPLSEFYECTIRLHDHSRIDWLAHAIQSTTHYMVNHLSPQTKSFNLVFYYVDDVIIVKILLRRPASPLLLGYRLSQVPNDLEHHAERVRSLYGTP